MRGAAVLRGLWSAFATAAPRCPASQTRIVFDTMRLARVALVVGLLAGPAAAQTRLAPNGAWVGGQPQLAPNGAWVGGSPQLAPDGSWVGGGRPQLAPDGSWVGGQPRLAPDGSWHGDAD